MGANAKTLLCALTLVLGFLLGVKYINTQHKLVLLQHQHLKQITKAQNQHAALMLALHHHSNGATQCN